MFFTQSNQATDLAVLLEQVKLVCLSAYLKLN